MALYNRLPVPARSAAATMRGLYLRFWRRGSETARLVAEAAERDQWSAEQWDAWRADRLALVLERAATRVPYYRDQWAARRRAGDDASWLELDNWPILEKDALREDSRRFLADDCNPGRLFHEQTSGTTGKPLHIWRGRSTVQSLYALVEARARSWNGVPAGSRYARLGGQLVTPVSQRHPPFWVWNAAMGQLYMSSYHLAPDLIPSYLDALVRFRVVFLTGYTSSLVALAHEVVRLGRRDLAMRAVFTNAEPLQPSQRALIAEAFQCPVRESYGQAESVAFGSECPEGLLHQWPEVGHIEVLDRERPVLPGDSGELICTGLLNLEMPLIRYRVGDRGRLSDGTTPCSCGRQLPIISGIEGRTTDVLLTKDGRKVFWLNPVFYGLPVRQAQIEQQTMNRLLVRASPARDFSEDTRRLIIERLRSRMGDVDVVVENVEEIPRTAAGKVRAVVCALSLEERAAVFTNAIVEAERVSLPAELS
jgi:phenylacetate-CoA ligase